MSTNAEPCIALALAIITHAVRAWQQNGDDPHTRSELLAFFHGEWFNFLLQSATTQIHRDTMFKALRIPMREMTG